MFFWQSGYAMRSDRLLSILLILQAHGRLTAKQMASRLEVSERTILRDLDALSAAGVPVYAERGRQGGIALLPGYRTDVSGLTSDEARALFVFAGRGTLSELGLERDLQAALRKVMAALPEPRRPNALHAQERVVVDPRGWHRPADDTARLPIVQEALWGDRQLRIVYRAAGQSLGREQVVDPWGVVVKAGIWYLIAAIGSEPRLYRVSRIEEAAILEQRSERPAGLDLDALWRRLRQRVEDRGPGVEVRLRVRPERAEMLLRLITSQLAGPVDEEPAPDASGWRVFHLPFVAEGAAQGALLGFGAEVEVLSPPTLRQMFAKTAREILDLYGG
jgi:predicted DNA-binding transcriptional regulator YafY